MPTLLTNWNRSADSKPEVVVRPTASHIVILEGATGSIKRDIQLPDVNASACPATCSGVCSKRWPGETRSTPRWPTRSPRR